MRLVRILRAMTIDTPTALRIAAIVLPAAAIGGVLVRAHRFVRGTTLTAPWAWAWVALLAVAGVELLAASVAASGPPLWLDAARYLAAVATFCPVMAVLGAKRPQDRAWQIIVASLWGVLSLPALQDLLYHYGQPVALDPAWRGFLAILIAVGLVNYLPTRFWPSSILFGMAQLVADWHTTCQWRCRSTRARACPQPWYLPRWPVYSCRRLARATREQPSRWKTCGAIFATRMACCGPCALESGPATPCPLPACRGRTKLAATPCAHRMNQALMLTIPRSSAHFVAHSATIRLARMDRRAIAGAELVVLDPSGPCAWPLAMIVMSKAAVPSLRAPRRIQWPHGTRREECPPADETVYTPTSGWRR